MIRVHGVWVLEELETRIREFVSKAPVGKRGWKKRAAKKAYWIAMGEL